MRNTFNRVAIFCDIPAYSRPTGMSNKHISFTRDYQAPCSYNHECQYYFGSLFVARKVLKVSAGALIPHKLISDIDKVQLVSDFLVYMNHHDTNQFCLCHC